MSTRLKKVQVRNLTPSDYGQCYNLNFRHNGLMMYRLLNIRESKSDGFAYLIKEVETDTLLAWALVKEIARTSEPEVYFYVRYTHRRMGYGSRLIKALNKDYDRIRVFPHDDTSEIFFNTFPDSTVKKL